MIGQLEVLGSRETFPQFLDRVLAVTPEEVRGAAETYLVDRARTAVRYRAEAPA
jgi:predicted Zn-dependent peptidase